MNNISKLEEEIERKKTEFSTESYPMSIGELGNLYKSGEVEINPEFQRYFRWSDQQKTRLLESLFLGIPIPSIFVYQRDDGVWELVDGLQRVSTILQFMGVLEDKSPLILQSTKYLPHLENLVWNNSERVDELYELSNSLKLKFKRLKLDFSIILSDSGKNAKFEVFQRLNTGGSFASGQEVRNSVMIMINKPTFEWFIELSKNEQFLETISLSDRLLEEQYNVELVLRFLALRHYKYSSKIDVSDYFDEVSEKILRDENFDYDLHKSDFESTFDTIHRVLGEKAFKRFDGTNFKGKFLESAFEAITVGLSFNLESYQFPNDDEIILRKVKELHDDETFKKYTGSGSNARSRIPKIIPFAKDHFSKD